jgi:hypothetical protein
VLQSAPVKLFLPQATLEDWSVSEKADLKDGKLVVADTKTAHPVTPAVHFISLISGTDDNKLVNKVKTHEQLEKLGGEQMMDSVLLGETAYQVIPGYVTEVAGGSKKKGANPEADLLAAFLLDKL